METRLNGVLIDRYGRDEKAGYPTLCKGRFEVGGETYYAIEEPTSLNTLELLPEMHAASASPPSRSKAASAARPTSPRSPRCGAPPSTAVQAQPRRLQAQAGLDGGTGQGLRRAADHTLGAYHRPWK